VTSIVEDSKGLLWLVSGILQRFDPATGSFTAYQIDPVEPDGRTGKVLPLSFAQASGSLRVAASWPLIIRACCG
jgi:streptogramin lyase